MSQSRVFLFQIYVELLAKLRNTKTSNDLWWGACGSRKRMLFIEMQNEQVFGLLTL